MQLATRPKGIRRLLLSASGAVNRLPDPAVFELESSALALSNTRVRTAGLSLEEIRSLDSHALSVSFPPLEPPVLLDDCALIHPPGQKEAGYIDRLGEGSEVRLITLGLIEELSEGLLVYPINLSLAAVTAGGSLFYRNRDAESPTKVVPPHVSARPRVERGEAPPPPLQPINLFELLLPILMPPARTEFGEEFLLPHDLYDFQRYGVKWLTETGSALLADDMGLGKTVQAIVAFRVLVRQGKALQALVVCPKSVRLNWVRELEKWAPELITISVSGSRENRRRAWSAYVGKSHIMIATYETVRQDIGAISGREFDVVIADEVQRVKNPSTDTARAIKGLACRRAWGLTGTPLENRIEDVVSVYGFIRPDLFSTDHVWIGDVKRKIEPFMLRRRKEEALKDLPPKIKDVKYVELDEAQERAYRRAEEQGVIKLRTGENITVQHVLALITQLKQICNFDPATGESAKLEFLQDYLEDAVAEESKVLIFSQFVRTLEWVEPQLSTYQPMLFSGQLTERQRQDIVDRFQEDAQHQVLLLSLKAGGLGLNLTAANYVVHFDSWWNPAVESQAEDRVYRIGQNKSVIVTSLVCVDTIEEKIQKLLDGKRELFREVIDDLSDAGLTKVLTNEELFGLFDLRPPRRRDEPSTETAPEIRGQVTPETPYTNIMITRRVIREGSGYIWWLDRHFDRKAFELLYELDKERVTQVSILSTRANIDRAAEQDFKRFRDEMSAHGITAEWRVADLHGIHDRFVVSQGRCYNVPPVNTLFSGGLSDIQPAVAPPAFERLWANAKSIFG